jgi:hypothetical protein
MGHHGANIRGTKLTFWRLADKKRARLDTSAEWAARDDEEMEGKPPGKPCS